MPFIAGTINDNATTSGDIDAKLLVAFCCTNFLQIIKK